MSKTAFEKLYAKDELLALLLDNSLKSDATSGAVRFVTESYSGGTISGFDGARWTHRGDFTREDSGEIIFRFQVLSSETGEEFTYIGWVRDGGRIIGYERTHGFPGGVPERSSALWQFSATEN